MVYDAITVGGGLAGAALARSLAGHGARVLVLEREERFRDRVRGEGLLPWGVAEARALGLYELVRDACGYEVPGWTQYFNGTPFEQRDLRASTNHGAPCLDFYHPDMQERLLAAAAEAGAEVRRGVTVTGVETGARAAVIARSGGRSERLCARLVVGADGRSSKVRRWAGFKVRSDPPRMVIAGLLLDGMQLPPDSVHLFVRLGSGALAILFPLGGQRFRAYFGYRRLGSRRRLAGRAHIPDFVAACLEAGAPEAWYRDAEPDGPLAMYEGADNWVDQPARDGVVLIGDAAAASDPTYGCGLALTLRDVRVLRDALGEDDDWNAAAGRYARAHDAYYESLHRLEGWLTDLFYEVGPEADARRARALPHLAADPTRLPDLVGLGPDCSTDDAARRRLFAEDAPDAAPSA